MICDGVCGKEDSDNGIVVMECVIEDSDNRISVIEYVVKRTVTTGS